MGLTKLAAPDGNSRRGNEVHRNDFDKIDVRGKINKIENSREKVDEIDTAI